MGFFSRIRRIVDALPQKTLPISFLAPIDGKTVPLHKLADAIFADKVIGDGIAIAPTGHQLLAPIDGVVAKIFDLNHAFTIESDLGIELLVHFGIDTITLSGEGFTRLIEQGQSVKAGTPIIAIDLEYLQRTHENILTPVIIANMEDISELNIPFNTNEGKVIAGKDIIYTATVTP